MTIRVQQGMIYLEGSCPVEDAEVLLVALQEITQPIIDVAKLERAHMAVAQLLTSAKPKIIGMPAAGFVREMLMPALADIN